MIRAELTQPYSSLTKPGKVLQMNSIHLLTQYLFIGKLHSTRFSSVTKEQPGASVLWDEAGAQNVGSTESKQRQGRVGLRPEGYMTPQCG